jgi:hypothetical protein
MNISRDGHTSSSSTAGGENDLLSIGFNQDSGAWSDLFCFTGLVFHFHVMIDKRLMMM